MIRRLVVAGAVLGLAAWGVQHQRDGLRLARGAELFDGRVPLAGRLVGHDAALPPLATRCTNCHAGSAPLGGVLGSARLALPQARRGGPPSAYDAARLCALLRSGVDPAQVIISTTMPRYDITDPQCADLWAHLTRH